MSGCVAILINKKSMTHVRNVEAFTRVVNFCTGYGGKYNPGHPNLRMDALTALVAAAHQSLEQVIAAKAHFDNEVNYRKQVFAQLPKLASSVLRTLEASGASEEKLKDARAFVQNLQGRVKPDSKEPVAETAEPVSKRSRLQLAYVSRADWFARLVEAVLGEPQYEAFEPLLSKAGLVQHLRHLQQLNRQVDEARVKWSQARLQRNEVLYRSGNSVARVMQAVKKYLRAIFGLNSEEYVQVKGIAFTKMT